MQKLQLLVKSSQELQWNRLEHCYGVFEYLFGFYSEWKCVLCSHQRCFVLEV